LKAIVRFASVATEEPDNNKLAALIFALNVASVIFSLIKILLAYKICSS
jgi:hypothetical protein